MAPSSADSGNQAHKLQIGGLRWSLGWPVVGVRHYLVALVLSVLVPMLLFSAMLADRYAQAQRHVIEAERVDVTNNLNDLIERDVARITGVLHGLAAALDAPSSQARFQELAANAMRLTQIEGLILTDATGKPVASAPADLPTSFTDTSFLATVRAGGTDVSNLLVDPASGAKRFIVSIPLARDGVVTNVLRAIVDVAALQGVFLEARLHDTWVSAIVDKNGIFLARSRAAKTFVGKPAHPALLAAARRAAPEGQFDNVTLDGTPVQNSYRRSPSGWTSVVGVPVQLMNAPRNRALALLGAAGLLLTTFAIGAAYFLGSHIARSIGLLQRGALDVVDGRTPGELPMPLAELRDVTAALDYAARQSSERLAAERYLRESEERHRLALDAGAFGSWDMDLVTGSTVWSQKLFSLYGHDQRPQGVVEKEVWQNRIHPDDRASVLDAFNKAKDNRQPFISEHRIVVDGTSEVRWLRATGQLYFDQNGVASRFIGVARDITARRTLEESLAASQARYRLALALGRIGSWETHYATGERLWTDEAQALFGLSLKDGRGRYGGDDDEFRAAMHPEDRHLAAEFRRLAETQDTFPAEYRIVRPDGTMVWVAGSGHVLKRDAQGKPSLLLSVVADITERKAAEHHTSQLMREIAHRSKNLLAVVQAVANQTRRSTTSLQEFHAVFIKRLHGLAASQDIVTEQDWRGAPVGDLVRQHLAPFVNPDSGRLRTQGPDATFDVNAAQAVGMALHELATNAVKYGALSTPRGTIDVTWGVNETDPTEFVVRWVESGGPPVTAASRSGFGQTVIKTMVAQAVRGTVTLEFAPDGLRWTLRMPSASIAGIAVGGRVAPRPAPQPLATH